MEDVVIEGLTKRFSSGRSVTTAVDDVSLRIEQGEFLVLLGPSGCGKTTTLRCLAGLERPNEGRIDFGKSTVFDSAAGIDLPPNHRNVGMVFQSFALWPNMTVRKNISYPLRERKMKAELASGWVDEVARIVDCGDLMDRLPAQLSGGQQQRVALARALVARPSVIFFDEPLSNLDAKLRREVRMELHQLHSKLGFTAVFVTHDQSEAMSLGDRLVVMRRGAIEQVGDPRKVRNDPRTEYVADFMGMENRIEVHRSEGEWIACRQPLRGELPASLVPTSTGAVLRLRPEDLRVDPRGETLIPQDVCAVQGTIIDIEFGGGHLDVIVDAHGTTLHAQVSATAPHAADLAEDHIVDVSFRPSDARAFELPPKSVSGALAAQDPAEL